jgi:hypothetical protein
MTQFATNPSGHMAKSKKEALTPNIGVYTMVRDVLNAAIDKGQLPVATAKKARKSVKKDGRGGGKIETSRGQ